MSVENYNRRILIVDDNRSIHEDLHKVLTPSPSEGDAVLEMLENKLFGASAPSKLQGPKETAAVPAYELDSAFQGDEGIEKVRTAIQDGRPYAAIFMDVRMPPGLDGIETTRKIWELDPSVEIIICTAFSDYSNDDMIAELGVSDQLLILKKPFDRTAVCQMALSVTTKWNLGLEKRRYIETLENKVAERTAELQATVEKLKETNNALQVSMNELLATRSALVVASKFSALGEMSGRIAHEINNPLAIILALADRVSDLMKPQQIDRSMIQDYCKRIIKTVQRISKTVTSLRNFSRDGKDDPFSPIALNKIIEDVLVLCRERFNNNEIELIAPAVPDDWVLECREVQVGQVLMNLLANAIDAVNKEPTKWVRIEAQDLGDSFELAVIDSGKGVDPSVRDKLFEPFFTTKSYGNGSGIGLSLSKTIVESHGGTISVDPAHPNTRFCARLPKQHR